MNYKQMNYLKIENMSNKTKVLLSICQVVINVFERKSSFWATDFRAYFFKMWLDDQIRLD